jgi:broad specificity phosphatase PhoE
MGTLYLVRHGQASFGADDYDVLSPLGHQQARRLGEHFKTAGIAFDSALTGTLQRQISTHDSICDGMGTAPQALRWPGLNEYDSHAVIATVHAEKLEKPTTPEMYRHHFRLLKTGLQKWMIGAASPHGMPSYPDFLRGVTSALDHVRENCTGNVLLVSSGGPIATAVGHVLGCPPEATIELNLRIRNSSVTEFAFTPKRHMLVTYNTLPHLDAPEFAGWVTYA